MDNIKCERVFVCGAGHQGLTMAAHLALNGVKVTLCNRSSKNIEEVIATREIHCKGVVNGIAQIEKASSDINEVVSDFVMVTTSSSAHKNVARKLAPFVHKEMIIILNPGRTFGAIEFANTLIECGVKELPQIAETQTIIYTCRKSGKNNVTVFALKEGVKIAAIKGSDINTIVDKIPECIRNYFTPTNSLLDTSLTNVGMILHCAPVLMNIGWIESTKVDFKYYYDGISFSIAAFLEKIDGERQEVAKAMGCKIESVADWLKRTYHVTGNSLYECIRNNNDYKEIDAPSTLKCRYLLEDVPNGLVPIESMGQVYGVSTPNISLVIDLANSVMNMDFRKTGRAYGTAIIERYI